MSLTKPLWLTYSYSCLLANIGSQVHVSLKEGIDIEGIFFNFDPSTHSLCLIQQQPEEVKESTKVKVLIILDHAVSKFQIFEDKPKVSLDLLSSLILEEGEKYESHSLEMERRKSILIEHLKEVQLLILLFSKLKLTL
ncbi:hypothetical protein K7432_001992 [Basidiobolus ranarum]|uniref:Uncharacterized protein n=1 Tax=Basidiobolus ranarum TaxID=34480 RepID=A0ABR2W8Q1_9FUNG